MQWSQVEALLLLLDGVYRRRKAHSLQKLRDSYEKQLQVGRALGMPEMDGKAGDA